MNFFMLSAQLELPANFPFSCSYSFKEEISSIEFYWKKALSNIPIKLSISITLFTKEIIL